MRYETYTYNFYVVFLVLKHLNLIKYTEVILIYNAAALQRQSTCIIHQCPASFVSATKNWDYVVR